MGVGDGDLLRMAGLAGLRGRGGGAGGEIVEGGDEFGCPAACIVVESLGDVRVVERQFESAQHGAGVHALVDAEHTDPTRGLTADECALDGGGSAVGRQQ